MVASVIDRLRNTGLRFELLAALAVVLTALSADVAVAQEKKPTYDVTIWGIRATKSNNKISPELKPIADQLKRQFKYTGFKLEKKATKRSVDEGSAFATNLIAGFNAKVTPVERKDNRIKLKIEVTERKDKREKPRMRTTVTIDRGRFQLQGGWKIEPKSEDVLIVAVSAR